MKIEIKTVNGKQYVNIKRTAEEREAIQREIDRLETEADTEDTER